MNKIVYNACFGGFGLSDAAVELYSELSGIALFPIKDRWHTFWFYEQPEGRTIDQMFQQKVKDFYPRNLERHDPHLVAVVEKLGELANGDCAKLEIYEATTNRYSIDEYDGSETVVECFDDRWTYIP